MWPSLVLLIFDFAEYDVLSLIYCFNGGMSVANKCKQPNRIDVRRVSVFRSFLVSELL